MGISREISNRRNLCKDGLCFFLYSQFVVKKAYYTNDKKMTVLPCKYFQGFCMTEQTKKAIFHIDSDVDSCFFNCLLM